MLGKILMVIRAKRGSGGELLVPVKPGRGPEEGSLERLLDECSRRGRAEGVVASFSLLTVRVLASGEFDAAVNVLRCLVVDRGVLWAKATLVERSVQRSDNSEESKANEEERAGDSGGGNLSVPFCACLDIKLETEDAASCQRRLLIVEWGGAVCRVELYREE